MGLAASQCRFLMLTSRQSDVEAKLMALSNQQMTLTSKSSKLATDYAKALSAQDVNFNDSPVSYSIMNPNMVEDEYGNVSQYLFKTSKGQVILSDGKASTLGLLPSDLDGKTSGTGYEFRRKFPTKDDFLKKVMTNYTPSASSNTDASGSKIAASGYKYDDTIMNNAVVAVQAASVLSLSGYGFEQLEYAMGTQENNLSSYACIWTLDQFQYTESNVHSIVNTFVESAMDEMAAQLLSESNLGSSDAVNYAINYAKEKTKSYYSKVDVDPTKKNIKDTLSSLDGLRAKDTNTLIKVSDKTYSTTQVQGTSDGSTAQTITSLTGKDIFVDTAQLTAVFLNFFDAGMLYAMADTIENKNAGLQYYNLSPKDEAYDENLVGTVKYTTVNEDGTKTEEWISLTEYLEKVGLATHVDENDDKPAGLDQIKYYADTIAAFNGDPEDDTIDNPLQMRLTKKYTQGVNGYNKSAITDDFSNASTGFFGDTVETATSGATGNSTITAQKAFYGYMYDALCANGWSYNHNITDDQFLSDQMQRQNIIMYEYSSSAKNGKSLSLEDSTSGLSLVDSSARLDKAEADYEAESAKIDYKTSLIQSQMDKLNTELTSIQNEKESIKSIIDKRTEKFNLWG